jgi:outer membrane protein OmpA-like peptidoglycan-associated protein/osmotically-inducible protein OsmY
MSYAPGRWWLGLAPLGVFWVLGTASETGNVEADLASRSKAALGADLVNKPTVAVAGRDVTLAGEAFAAASRRSAIRAVRSEYGVRSVDDGALGEIAEAKPYVWSAKREGGRIALGGSVPNPAARAAINAVAKSIAGAEVADGMGYARGDTAALAAGSTFALGELRQLPKGEASLSNGALTLTGLAADFPGYEKAMAALKSPPAGVTIASAEITPPLAKPYVFSAVSSNGALKLTGVAPSFASRDAIATAAAAVFPHANIDNALTIASGAPKGDYDADAKFALAELGRFSNGSATLSDGALTVNGLASGSQAYESALSALKALPDGVSSIAKAEITPPLAKPFVFAAASGGGAVRLTGAAPSVASRDAIAGIAGNLFPGATIDNSLAIASGAPSGDFEAAVKFALTSMANLDNGRATLTDNSLSISGKARAPGAIEAFDKSVAGLAPGFTLAIRDIIPATVRPFVFSAESAPGRVTLAGHVPSAASREAIAADAEKLFPGATIENGLLVANGAPEGDFDGAAKLALSQIAKLDGGKAVLTDSTLEITGKARAPGAIEALETAGAGLGSGFTLATSGVVPVEVHPYVFTASKSADGIGLSGSVPSLAERRMVEAAARQIAAGQPVINETKVAGGLPKGVDFGVVAQFGLAELSRLASGEAKLSDADFSLQGMARDAASADEAKTALGDLLAGVKIADSKIEAPAAPASPPQGAEANPPAATSDWDNVAADAASAAAGPPLDASACESGFKDALNGVAIEFDSGEATISPASYPLIVKLAGIALRCQVPQIEVAGYTDNTGDDSINIPLSQSRAEAVANVLVKAGVPVSRLSAVGYGSADPIASNDTEAGRAKNRRIEFEVKS